MSLATSIGSSAVYEEPTASLFRVARTEVLIDRPAADVWCVLVDLTHERMKAWNPSMATTQLISGDPTKENALVLITKDMLSTVPKGTRQPPFYMRVIRMVPNQQRVLRIDAVDRSFSAFVDHSLYESGGKTRVVYNGYLEVRRITAEQMKASDLDKAAEDMMQYLNHSHGLLKKIVEERSSGDAGHE
jgi:hypothetical protein